MVTYRIWTPPAARHLAFLVALASSTSAAAQATELEPLNAELPGKENVWSKGVPEASRRAADALFAEGNALLRESITISAAAKYREALKHWDHPNIHYNLALALMNLDQPIETHHHFVAAMKYGPEPLQKERFEHAKNYLGLLQRQIAHLKVRCEVPGARVELDGATLFTPPGEYEGLIRAGRHSIVATREGLVTNNVVRTFAGGQTTLIDLNLKSLEDMTQYRRRWSTWVPWSILGGGAALALAGGYLQYSGLQKIARVDRESRALCATGCVTGEPASLARDRTRGAALQKLGIGAYGIGGAALATGGLLLYLNRAERFVQPYESGQQNEPPQAAAIELSPVIDDSFRGLMATIRY